MDLFLSFAGVGNFLKLRDKNTQIMGDILTGTYEDIVAATSPTIVNDEEKAADEANFGMIKHFFEACMNESLLDQRGTQPIETFLTTLQGEKTFLDVVAQLELSGVGNPLFTMGVDPDEKNPNQNVVTLMQPTLGLPSKEYFGQEEYLSVYRATMMELAKLALPDLDEAEVNLVVDFETQLASLSSSL